MRVRHKELGYEGVVIDTRRGPNGLQYLIIWDKDKSRGWVNASSLEVL